MLKKSRFTEKTDCLYPVAGAIGYVGVGGLPLAGMSEAKFYTWRKRYGGLSRLELKHLRKLDEENLQLKS